MPVPGRHQGFYRDATGEYVPVAAHSVIAAGNLSKYRFEPRTCHRIRLKKASSAWKYKDGKLIADDREDRASRGWHLVDCSQDMKDPAIFSVR